MNHRIATFLIFLFSAFGAHSQSVTTLMAPFPAGGSLDNLARIVSQKISEQTGDSFVVENRAGANGQIGSKAAAQANPDGKTWLFGVDSVISVNPFLYPKDAKFSPETDLKVVRGVALQPSILVVNPNVPAKNVKEFVAFAKQHDVTYGSGGIGSAAHLAMELLGSAAGVKMTHVPYKGAPPAMMDLIAGRLQATFVALPNALPYVKSGKVVALAIASPQRSQQLPNIPTMAESGYPGLHVEVLSAVMVPSKTPPAIASKIESAVAKALADPSVQERIAATGWTPTPDMSGSEATKWIEQAKAQWGVIIKQKDIRAE